ncbi:MAG: TIGR04133 family radical SAM/SPASM protein [Bacteroidales bacterium]|nr:TIGR04133 family radical SAM/SPASM protein [Bacteroidales bacterium]
MKIKIPLKLRFAFFLHRRFKKNLALIHDLQYLFWECTLRCNFECIHCGSDCLKSSDIKDMPIADFIRVIDEIKPTVNPNKTMIVFTGGEALMRNDLEECGKMLNERGFPWGLVSNGYLLTQKRLESLLSAGMLSITISLDGLNDSHNWLRNRPDSFEKAIDAIRRINAVPGLTNDVVTCVNQRNISELEAIKQLLLDSGVTAWRIFSIAPIGRAAHDGRLHLNPEEFLTLMRFMEATRKEGKIKLNFGCGGFLGEYEGRVRDNLFYCAAGINVGSVLVDGSISACPNLRENFIQGNIYKDNFVDVWNNNYKKYRNRSWTKKGMCADCNMYNNCQGNGLHLRDEKTGLVQMCHLKLIEDAKKLELK